MRLVRLDDFPTLWRVDGHPGFPPDTNPEWPLEAMRCFEQAQVPYIIGVIPELIDVNQTRRLNSVLHYGCAVMHGFNHGFFTLDWSDITKTWPTGGEFTGMSKNEVKLRWLDGVDAMRGIWKCDFTQTILPFNTVTQEALTAFAEVGVKTVHTASQEYNNYHYEKLNWHGMEVRCPGYGRTYNYAREILNLWTELDQPQDQTIALHWGFDQERRHDWISHYRELAHRIAGETSWITR